MWRIALAFVVAGFTGPAMAQSVTLDQATAGHLYSYLGNGGTYAEADLLRAKLAEALQASRTPPSPEHPPVTQAKPDAPATPNPSPTATPH